MLITKEELLHPIRVLDIDCLQPREARNACCLNNSHFADCNSFTRIAYNQRLNADIQVIISHSIRLTTEQLTALHYQASIEWLMLANVSKLKTSNITSQPNQGPFASGLPFNKYYHYRSQKNDCRGLPRIDTKRIQCIGYRNPMSS